MMRDDYHNDRSLEALDKTITFTADLQKVLLLPILPTKECFFKSRLVCFNETFGSLSNKPDYAVLWHEAISGRKAISIISTIYALIQNTCDDMDHLIIWADNCAAQNKNWRLYFASCVIVNTHKDLKSITFKYLEKGHTYMRSDCIHGAIGKKLKRSSRIYTFDDLKTLILSSMGNLQTIDLEN